MKDSPRVDWRLAVMSAAVLVVLFTLQGAVATQPGAKPTPIGLVFTRQIIVWGVWLALTPLVIAVARRYPFGESSRSRWILRHLLIGGAFSIAHSMIGSFVRMAVGINVYESILDATLAAFLINIGRNYLCYGLITASYSALAYHRAVRDRDMRAARLEIDLTEAKLSSLESRLRPHFLFNTLNAIAALIREDPAAAESMIGQLSDLLRASLRADPGREIRLDEELHLVQQYLAIQQVRFNDRLHVSLEASDTARRAYVPQLILQPLVENAVRHGIAPRESGGSVWVFADQPNGHLRLRVEDDGVGMGDMPSPLAGNGIGLGGLKSRLAHLYGADQRVEVAPRETGGTRVTIEIPYHTESNGE